MGYLVCTDIKCTCNTLKKYIKTKYYYKFHFIITMNSTLHDQLSWYQQDNFSFVSPATENNL